MEVSAYIDQAKEGQRLNREWLLKYLLNIGCDESQIGRITERVDKIVFWAKSEQMWETNGDWDKTLIKMGHTGGLENDKP